MEKNKVYGIAISFIIPICMFIVAAGSFPNASPNTLAGNIPSPGEDTTSSQQTQKENNNHFRFFIFGDWGWNGYLGQREVADRMGIEAAKKRPDCIISVGDNFQFDGVRSVDDSLWSINYERVYHQQSLQIDWYCVLGNHDYQGNPQAEIDYSRKSGRWHMPARFYAVHKNINDTTGLDVYFLDTSPLQKQYYSDPVYRAVIGQDTSAQLRWIDSALAASKSRWKIVVGHHGVFTSGIHSPELGGMAARFAPLFSRWGVDAYFCGHDHQLEYLKTAGSDVRYFVSGAGSIMLRSGKRSPYSKFLATTPGFMEVTLSSDSMNVRVIDYRGTVLYNEVIKK